MRQTLLLLSLSILVLTSCQKSETVDGNISARPGGGNGGGGSVIPSVKIGKQVWSSQNLDVSRYRNGDPILQVTDGSFNNLTIGAWCWYNNDSVNYSKYGKIYNWYAVNDPRGLAPLGWHVPTDAEWNILVKYIDPNADTNIIGIQSTIAGGQLKEKGTLNWLSPNTGANNKSGFRGLPGGNCGFDGFFRFVNTNGFWWTATEATQINPDNVWTRTLFYDNSAIERNYYDWYKNLGASVRLVRN